MKKHSCSVSVIMPVFNTEKYVSDAISSILNQTFTGFEFIVIDDCSNDGSMDIIQSFTDDRMIIVKNEKNLGNYPSRNIGIRMSTGKYIAVMDADDIALPDRLRKQYDYMENNPDTLATGTQYEFLEKDSKRKVPVSYLDICAGLLDNNCILHPSLFLRSEVIKQSGGYDEQYAYASDYDLVCRLSLIGKVENLKDTCLRYRWHPGQISRAKFFEQQGYADIIRQKYQIAFINRYKQAGISEAGEAETGYPDMGRLIGLYVMGARFGPSFQEQANRLLDNIVNSLDASVPLQIKKGLSGFGSGVMYLIRNQFVEGDENEVLENIDEVICDAILNDGDNQEPDLEGTLYYLEKRASMPDGGHLPARRRIKKAISRLLEIRENDRQNDFNKKQLFERRKLQTLKLIPALEPPKPLAGLAGNNSPQYIVSLTSYGKRLTDTAPFAIVTLLNQSVKPDKTVLWISHKDRELISPIIYDLVAKGLEICFCEDVKSYTKLIFALEAFPRDYIITADDDVYYPENWFEQLLTAHKKNPGKIICHRAHGIKVDNSHNPLPYLEWHNCISPGERPALTAGEIQPEAIFPTGVAGVLYPPGCLYKDVSNRELFMRLAPHADDIWFWAMAVLNRDYFGSESPYTVIEQGYSKRLHDIDPEQKREGNALWIYNSKGGNDRQLKAVIEHYPQIRDCLNKIEPSDTSGKKGENLNDA